MDTTPLDLRPHPQAIIFEKSTHTKSNHNHHQQQNQDDDRHEKQVITTTTTTTTSISPASPPSSPSHEFSFTISLHSSSSTTTTASSNDTKSSNKTSVINSSSLVAIDLSPADDIFFHGHLLPLHLLSHLPTQAAPSPRSSTNSRDSVALPIAHFHLPDPNPPTTVPAPKSKSFSLFSKWKTTATTQTNYDDDKDEDDEKTTKKRKDMMSQFLRMVRPLLPFRRRGKGDSSSSSSLPWGLRRPPNYSFSGILGSRNTTHNDLNHRPGRYSAPASIRTSPSNSGPLVATSLPSSASDSTMEELQAAIQAAIAHCKNSIADNKPLPPPP